MKNVNWKELFIDILVDIVAGMIIAVGIYNFALNADFPVAGFSGIAIILYHIFGLPVGAGTIILNVPVAIFCYKFLGKEFFLKSMKSMIISSLLMDYVAPMFPVYNGSRLLAALCMGVLCGIGYAMIFMNLSSGSSVSRKNWPRPKIWYSSGPSPMMCRVMYGAIPCVCGRSCIIC